MSFDDLILQWALCWHYAGRISGETVDYARALEKFKIGKSETNLRPEFYRDYGLTLIECFKLVENKELLIEASQLFDQATKCNPSFYDGWLNLALTYQMLYEYYMQLEHFDAANEHFERAVAFNSEDARAWIQWGLLFSTHGRFYSNVEHLNLSLDKFEKGFQLEQDQPNTLLLWGEVQMTIAALTEDLELLKEAESKIRRAVTVQSDDPHTWYIFGECLCEFGRYFSTEEYFFQAIEKFQYGLTYNPTHIPLLHGMATAHLSIGELINDTVMLEQAVRFYTRINELESTPSSAFLSEWGTALMKLGEITQDKHYVEIAAEKFEQAIHLQVDSPEEELVNHEWLYNYGCAMDFLGDFHEESSYYEKAVSILSHVVSSNPSQMHARYHLALALFHLGELQSDTDYLHKASDLFHDILQEDSEDEMSWNDYGLTLLNWAVLKQESLRSEESEELFTKAEEAFLRTIGLGNNYALYHLSCLYALVNNIDGALLHLTRAETANALPPIAEIMQDEWLDSLQSHPEFREILSRLIHKQKDQI